MFSLYILTTDERVFLPPVFSSILEAAGSSVRGAAILPAAARDGSLARRMARYWRFDGPKLLLHIPQRVLQILWRRAVLGREHLVPIERIFARHSIPVRRFPAADDPALREHIEELGIDVLLNCQPGILGEALLRVPRSGCLNIHSSALPKFRGLEPVFHALLAGEKSIGVSLHEMTPELDAGVVRAQASVPATKSVFDCYLATFELVPGLLLQALSAMQSGETPPPAEAKTAARGEPTGEESRTFRRKGLRYL